MYSSGICLICKTLPSLPFLKTFCFSCLLRTNKPMRRDFLSIFLEDFRTLERQFFFLNRALKKCRKWWCGAGLVFIPNTEKLVLQDLKWKEEKQINFQVVSEWKIKVYLVLKPSRWIIFPSFNCCKNMTISALWSTFWIQITDLKQLPGL